jgi:radical SAM superfamily enzyme YgiQ (UPF0313 family)
MKHPTAASANVLLVAPIIPPSFWSFRETNRLMGARTLLPPLGLITVAALLPREWNLRLVDLNVRPLTEDDWNWADIVMISAMLVQRTGMLALIAEAKRRGKVVVAGGPYPTSSPDEVLAAGCDFLVKGEGENTIPLFLDARAEGRTGGVIACAGKPALSGSPVPRFDLLDIDSYGCLSVQTSRGCPFDCEFCDVVNLYGREFRHKSPGQVLAELDAVHRLGWRGDVFIADDNFIGNKAHARALLLELIPWMESRGKPFDFITQASVNLGQDRELIDLMTAANFGYVFVGVESPDEEVLARSNKLLNIRNPLAGSLQNINRNGLTVIASFVLGLDGERRGAGGRIAAFVDSTGLPLVTLNILQAIPNTRLWDRLKREGRLRELSTGDTTSPRLNFLPGRPEAEIISEYLALWDTLYDPRRYYDRVRRCILEMRPTRRALAAAKAAIPPHGTTASATASGRRRGYLAALWRLFWRRAVLSRYNGHLLRLTLDVFRRNPSRLRRFFILCAMGESLFPLRKLVRQQVGPGAPPAPPQP